MRKYLLLILLLLVGLTIVSCKENNDKEDEKNTYEKDYLVKNVYDGKTITNETVVLIDNGTNISGNLLYKPTKILSVKSYDLKKTYDTNEYEINGRTIIATKNSTMPYLTSEQLRGKNMPEDYGFSTYASLDGGEIIFTEGIGIICHQVSVTYEHNGSWNGFTQSYQGELLPKTMQKLKEKQNLTIVFNGDSIMTGCNSSGVLGIQPYLDDFPTLVCDKLQHFYGITINKFNTAVGGMLSDFGRVNIEANVNAYNPDLVIGFGMNDGSWNIPASIYKDNIKFMIQAIQKHNPNAEILLISTILANPASIQNTSITPTYLNELKDLVDTYNGVALVDMTSFSQCLYELKNSVDVLANNINHPSDFLVRCYADNILRALIEE